MLGYLKFTKFTKKIIITKLFPKKMSPQLISYKRNFFPKKTFPKTKKINFFWEFFFLKIVSKRKVLFPQDGFPYLRHKSLAMTLFLYSMTDEWMNIHTVELRPVQSWHGFMLRLIEAKYPVWHLFQLVTNNANTTQIMNYTAQLQYSNIHSSNHNLFFHRGIHLIYQITFKTTLSKVEHISPFMSSLTGTMKYNGIV